MSRVYLILYSLQHSRCDVQWLYTLNTCFYGGKNPTGHSWFTRLLAFICIPKSQRGISPDSPPHNDKHGLGLRDRQSPDNTSSCLHPRNSRPQPPGPLQHSSAEFSLCPVFIWFFAQYKHIFSVSISSPVPGVCLSGEFYCTLREQLRTGYPLQVYAT